MIKDRYGTMNTTERDITAYFFQDPVTDHTKAGALHDLQHKPFMANIV